jgi:acyl-CoA thioester hydrolase
VEIRVYYEDTDAGGIVYHSNYLNFCERARSELFFSQGSSPALKNGHFVARSIQADFFKPAKLADLLQVSTKLVNMKGASFTMYQEVLRDNEKLFSMSITLAYISYNGKLLKMDNTVKEFLTSLLNN